MEKEVLIQRLINCIYVYNGSDKVSVAKLKRVINDLEGDIFTKHRYSAKETRLT